MSNVIPDEINRVTLRLLRSTRQLDKAQDDYADAMRRMGSDDPSVLSRANEDLVNAISNGAWFARVTSAYGSALAGLCLSQMGEPRA